MKKLLLAGLLCTFGLSISTMKAQSLYPAATQTYLVKDTLHYYLNKYYFKNGRSKDSAFAVNPNYVWHYYPADATALATYTNISYVASRFEVPAGDSVTVTGVEVAVAKAKTTVNLQIPIRVYLLNLDASGVPKLPAVDSATVNVQSQNMTLVGANFTSTVAATIKARTMKNNFAVAVRNISGASGDYLFFFMTNGATTANQYGQYWYGEGNSFLYYQGQWRSTTNFSSVAGRFGPTTDYEFFIAPRVNYIVKVGQEMPDHPNKIILSDDTNPADTLCTRTQLTFKNASSKFFSHRMYNFASFTSKWNLYYPLSDPDPGSPNRNLFNSADSAISWYFEILDFPGNGDPKRILPYSNPNGQVSVRSGLTYYPTPPCFTSNQFRIRHRHMGAFGKGMLQSLSQDFIICQKFCDQDTVGISRLDNYETLKVYPNPAVNGKTTISGMKEKNTITVFNMMGAAVHTEVTNQANTEVDLSKFAKGTYLVRITNSNNETRMVRILNP